MVWLTDNPLSLTSASLFLLYHYLQFHRRDDGTNILILSTDVDYPTTQCLAEFANMVWQVISGKSCDCIVLISQNADHTSCKV